VIVTTASNLVGFGSAIRVIDQSHRGVSAARNLVKRASPGKFLASLDAYDVWLAGKLTQPLAALEQNPSAVPVFSDYIRILDSALLGECSHIDSARSMDDLLSRVGSILRSTVVMRKSANGRCGGCSEKLPQLEDPYSWLLARELGEFVYASEPLVCYRETSIARLACKYESGRLPLFRLLSGRYGSCAVRLIKGISDYFALLLVAKVHGYDVARAIEAIYRAPGCARVYYIGGGRDNSCSILEAFRLVEVLTGKAMQFDYSDSPRSGDHICYITDLSALRAAYRKWRVTRTLNDIAGALVDSWKQRIAGGEARSD
jgi:hypothetical protein